MQLKEEATGLKEASLPLFLAFLGGFPLIRGNLVWEVLAWEDLGKSPPHTEASLPKESQSADRKSQGPCL